MNEEGERSSGGRRAVSKDSGVEVICVAQLADPGCGGLGGEESFSWKR